MIQRTKDLLWLYNHNMISKAQLICCLYKVEPKDKCEDIPWVWSNWKQGEQK